MTDISFTLPKGDGKTALKALEEIRPTVGFHSLQFDDQIGKLSLVGAGMRTNTGVSATFFAALADAGVNVEMISTSEIRISVVTREERLAEAVRAVHLRVRPGPDPVRPSSTREPVAERGRCPDDDPAAALLRAPTLAVVGATGAVGRVLLQVLPTRAVVGPDQTRSPEGRRPGDHGRRSIWSSRRLTEEFFDDVDVAAVDIPLPWSTTGPGMPRGEVLSSSTTPRSSGQTQRCRSWPAEVNPQRVRTGRWGSSPTRGDGHDDDRRPATLHAGWQPRNVVTTSRPPPGWAARGSRASMTRSSRSGDRTLGATARRHPPTIEHELGESASSRAAGMNVLPMVGHLADDGWTSEEVKVREETRRILGLPGFGVGDLRAGARGPSHSINVHARFANRIDVGGRVRRSSRPGRGRPRRPEHAEFPPRTMSSAPIPAFAGRIRQVADGPATRPRPLPSGDNLRKGAALNMLQTAELIRAELLA